MNTEIVKQESAVVQSQSKPEIDLDDIELTATIPSEMMDAQQNLIVWCDKKIAVLRKDAAELKENIGIAKRNKWRHKVFERHHKIAEGRISYYKKIKATLNEGYYIVPNFPVELFAVRTTSDKPLKLLRTWERDHEQKLQGVEQGEGEYKSNLPEIFQHTIMTQTSDGKERKETEYWAENFKDVEFPINMAKPVIMEATERAMALKIFDRFGVLPGVHRKSDPVIIGQIVFKNNQYNERIVSFMIAWHLNTNQL